MKRQNKFGWIAGFSVLLLGFIAIPVALIGTKPPETDTENCRRDGVIPAHTIVLVDQSDPFEPADVDWAWQLMFDEAKALKKHGRLTIVGIDAENPDQGASVFSRCSPGSPNQANPIFENPRFIEQDWKTKFEQLMRERTEELMLHDQAPQSPLLEHMRGILRRADFRTEAPLRRIVIISDMYQHSDAYSMYNSGLNRELFDRAAERIEFPDMSGVTVAIFRVDRKTKLKGADIIAFWQDALAAHNVGSVEIIRD